MSKVTKSVPQKKSNKDPFSIANAYLENKFNPYHPNISRYYANVNLELGSSHWNYRDWNPVFGKIERYFLVEYMGSGRYSDVFMALQDKKKKCAAKLLKPVNTDRVRRELKVLTILRNGPNVLDLWDIVIDSKYGIPTMITEYVDNIDWRVLFSRLDLDGIRFYIYRLLQALDFTHKFGIMHRDVKPVNILCVDPKQELKLADWGLAEFYHPMRQYSASIGTRYYKTPETLLGYDLYDYSIDTWAAGVILLELLTLDIHIFDGDRFKCEQIDSIAKVVGGQAIVNWAKKYRKPIPPETAARLLKYPKIPFELLIPSTRKGFKDPDAIELVSRLLDVDHKRRISAEGALRSHFFDPIRNQVYLEIVKKK
ncbi:hypothetical protein M9Y10_044106 [Tritrichomonas musculus]|uniref:non-specific serine/threonine protein kinase n=1 Tax=Tritrichomonas musculus TaxID=1915356 RepID=A0ABR2K1M4_9EUKA